MGVEDKFDGEVGGDHGYDGVLSATVGYDIPFPRPVDPVARCPS